MYRFNKPNPFGPVVWQARPRSRPFLRVVLLFKALLKQLLIVGDHYWYCVLVETYSIHDSMDRWKLPVYMQLLCRGLLLFCNSLQPRGSWFVASLRSLDFALSFCSFVFVLFFARQDVFSGFPSIFVHNILYDCKWHFLCGNFVFLWTEKERYLSGLLSLHVKPISLFCMRILSSHTRRDRLCFCVVVFAQEHGFSTYKDIFTSIPCMEQLVNLALTKFIRNPVRSEPRKHHMTSRIFCAISYALCIILTGLMPCG